MSCCPNCGSGNVDVIERGFSKDTCKCKSCGKRFPEPGTGKAILSTVATIIGVVAGVDTMNHDHHWWGDGS